MTIATPTTAQKTEDFTSTQLAKVKKDWKLNGNEVFTLTKPSTNHIIPVPINDGFGYYFRSETRIYDGETLADLESSTFQVKIDEEIFIDIGQLSFVEVIDGIANITPIKKTTDFLFYKINEFGSAGTGNGEFDGVKGVTFSLDKIYACDENNERIQVFDFEGNYLSQFTIPTTSSLPRSITNNGNNIFLVEHYYTKIQKFDMDGSFVAESASIGSMNSITSNDEYIYVCYDGGNVVKIYDFDLNFISNITGFTSPYGVAATNEYVYVQDGTTIYKFDKTGTSISTITITSKLQQNRLAANSKYLFYLINDTVEIYDRYDNLINTVAITFSASSSSNGVFVSANYLCITDGTNNKVQIYK